MKQYIDKSALVAEIEKLLDKGKYHDDYDCAFRDGNNAALYALKGKIETLETKDVESVQEKPIISDSSETLGNHLRNLLTPYCTLLNLVKDVNNGKIDKEFLKKYKCDNLEKLIEFSKSEQMENNIWRV